LHNYGASVEFHGLFPFICIGFFHIGWMGVPNHFWAPILECMKMWKTQECW
jgi:hypothetical protein